MWWLKLAWYTARLLKADMASRHADDPCACPGCDRCAWVKFRGCSRERAGGSVYCTECEPD
jgi:hypothetical protein